MVHQVRERSKCARVEETLQYLTVFSSDASTPSWKELEDALKAVTAVVQGLVEFTKVLYTIPQYFCPASLMHDEFSYFRVFKCFHACINRRMV